MTDSLIHDRSFCLRIIYGELTEYGTGFTIEKDDTQFLATASHLFPYAEDRDMVQLQIRVDNSWEELNCQLFKHPNRHVDIVILSLPQRLSKTNPIKYTTGGIMLSQDAYIVGFPYGRYMENHSDLSIRYPAPYIKKGIISAIHPNKEGVICIFLDGMNNPGFSGGACVYRNLNDNSLCIAGVVKGYIPDMMDVKTPFGEFAFDTNSGIIEIHSVEYVKELLALI